MFRLESNAEGVLLNFLSDVETTERGLSELLRRAAVDSVALIADRIQQRGRAATGVRLQTKAKLKQGAYSAAHAKRRAERGRQTALVDLTGDGDLMRSFQALSVTDRLATAGFLSDGAADIAQGLEAYYGEEIFSLSASESDTVANALVEAVLDKLQTA